MDDSSTLILDIKDLSISFPQKHFYSSSLKEVFINLITFKKATKEDDLLVLNKINLKIWKGDRVGIIAKNGTGKSTLCRCISGFYQPQKGNINRIGTIRALYESSLAFFMELSGRENMRVLADIFYDRKVDNIPQLIDESIGFSELNDFIDAPLKTYSKGMLLRLTLSLLSAKPTDLLILDEVFDGADEFFRKKLSLRVRNLINNSSAVILVSHQEEQILEICNRVIVMKAGRIIFDGDPAKAFEVYRNNE